MTPGPSCRKCTAYLRLGPGGMPLALRFTEVLGHARGSTSDGWAPRKAMWLWKADSSGAERAVVDIVVDSGPGARRGKTHGGKFLRAEGLAPHRGAALRFGLLVRPALRARNFVAEFAAYLASSGERRSANAALQCRT